jgi:hypothetical protein
MRLTPLALTDFGHLSRGLDEPAGAEHLIAQAVADPGSRGALTMRPASPLANGVKNDGPELLPL